MAASAVALAVVLACAIFDWRSQKIPNAVTFPAMVVGLGLYGFAGGADGIAFSGKGLALGAGFFFVPYYLGGMGAGDVKLMGAVGALLGWRLALVALFYTALAGGLLAVLVILRRRAVGRSLAGIAALLSALSASKRLPTADTLEGERIAIPYALPIALGTAAALGFGWPL